MATLTSNFGWQKPGVNDPIDANQWGTELNGNLDNQDTLCYAFSKTNIGTSRPSYASAGTMWIDNTTNPWLLNLYDGTQDILIGDIDTVTGEFTPSTDAILTSKGDLLTNNGTQDVRLAVGTNGQVLTSDSAQSAGIKWSTVSNQLGSWIFVTFVGSTPTIAASNNVTSIIDNGVGDFTVNFTTALPSANYVLAGAAQRQISGNVADDIMVCSKRGSVRTSSSCPVYIVDGTNNGRDPQNFGAVFLGG